MQLQVFYHNTKYYKFNFAEQNKFFGRIKKRFLEGLKNVFWKDYFLEGLKKLYKRRKIQF